MTYVLLDVIKIQKIDAKNQLINQARKQLVDNGFLDATGEKIKVELVRRWIIKRYPLQDQIGQFHEFEQKKIPNQKEVIQLPEIVENNHTNNIITNHSNSHTDISTKRPLMILTAVATTMTIAASILVASYTNFSLPDSKRELKISSSPTPPYAPDNNTISRGDKTLFSNINNRFRDQGIEAFKNGNYQEAVNLFQQAVKANPYDPEVLIYYNNARASQNISSVSLAVVVPIDSKTNNDNAQEILRGVAQAQDQFNNNQGSNGLLLKVVIVNDSNNPKEAKQVVQEIVKDDSILGVIGHNSSDVTKAVIPAYKKAGLAIISSTATSNLLKSSVFFRVVDSDEIAGKKLAQYTDSLGFKKVVIFNNPNSAYSQSITEAFTNKFKKMGGKVLPIKKMGGKVLPTIDLSDKEFDPREEVRISIKEFQAEAAILFPDTEHTNATIDIAKANDDNSLSLLGGHTLYSNDTLIKGRKAVEGMILSVPWFRETLQAKAFAEKSGKKWGGGISWRTATSFDATQAFIQALSKDNTQDNTRAKVLERLKKVELNNNQTSGYPLQFKEGERQGQSVLVEVKDGKFTMIIP